MMLGNSRQLCTTDRSIICNVAVVSEFVIDRVIQNFQSLTNEQMGQYTCARDRRESSREDKEWSLQKEFV